MCGTMSLLLLLSGIFEESGSCFAAAFDAVFLFSGRVLGVLRTRFSARAARMTLLQAGRLKDLNGDFNICLTI